MSGVIFDASEFDTLGRAISRLPADIKTKAAARAMTRLRQRARTEIVNHVTAYTQMPKGSIREMTRTAFAAGNAVEIVVKSNWIGLYALGARQTSSGVSVRGRGRFDHAFIATVGKSKDPEKASEGHVGVFLRERGTKMEGRNKEKIRELFGANPAHAILNNPEVYLDVLADLMERELMPRFIHELGRILP